MLNHFRVIANEPITINGQSYEAGEELTLYADDCALLLVQRKVRLATTPAPPVAPVRRRRGRPRKAVLRTSPPAA